MLSNAISIYLVALALVLVAVMIRSYVQRRCELFSLRNFFLGGFIVFQLISPATALWTGEYVRYYIADPGMTGLHFSILATLFLLVFFFVYHRGWGSASFAARMPCARAAFQPGMLLTIAIVLTLIALALRFTINVRLLWLLGNFAAIGCASIACGLAGWVWVRRPSNLVFLGILMFVLILNSLNLLYGEFGRRALLAVWLAVLWGMYYGRWRYLPAWRTLAWAAAAAVVPLIIVSLYTDARSAGDKGRTATAHLQAMRYASFSDGFYQLASGQNTGSSSLWLIENTPLIVPERPLMTLRYLAVYPVPRVWWPSKPETLSMSIASDARFTGVVRDRLTIGPGIIGSIAVEGGLYAAVIYAAFFGWLLRLLDRWVLYQPWNPFVVLVVGVGLGQILGLARGETAVFMAHYLLAFTGAWLFTIILIKPIEGAFAGYVAPAVAQQPPPADLPDGANAR